MESLPHHKKLFVRVFVLALGLVAFPWILSFHVTVFGQLISVSSPGDAIGIIIALAGVAMFVSEAFRRWIFHQAAQIEQLADLEKTRLLVGLVVVYFLGVVSYKLRAHYLLRTHAYDLGYFSNVCWNTANGRPFFTSELERNFLGVHVNWILWPLSLVYHAYSSATVLLIAQAAFVAACLPILWRLTQSVTGSFCAGGLATLLFVCSPYVGHSVSNDFHPDLWQLPCLFAALAAWSKKERSWLLFFSMFALMAKEDVSVVLCGFAVMLFLQREWRATAVALAVIALGAFYFHIKIVIPTFVGSGETSLLYDRYRMLGGNFAEMAANLVHHPSRWWAAILNEPIKYWRFISYFFTVGGLVLFAPLFVVPPIISVLPHFLSQASTQLELADIYALPSQPFLFVGGVIGARYLVERHGAKIVPSLVGLLFIVSGVGLFNAPRYFRSLSLERRAAFSEVEKLIPPTASVAAQQNLQPHFSERRYIQLFPIHRATAITQTRALKNPEFVLADRIGNALPYSGEALHKAIEDFESDPRYEKIYEKENFILFKRKANEPLRWEIYTNEPPSK